MSKPTRIVSQDGTEVVRCAHHAEVGGSNPSPATHQYPNKDMAQTLEDKVAKTILQQATKVKIGDKEYTAAPPSIATLILVSEAVSHLPQQRLDESKIAQESLAVAKDCKTIGDIAAILLLGARNIRETVTTQETRREPCLWGLFNRTVKVSVIKEIDRKAELSKVLLETLSPSEIHALIATCLSQMELGDFFALTTFLTDINLMKQTKVETVTTASGQS